MDLVSLAVQLLNGVQYGLVLFLVASGLTLVFGILGVINLAHGAFYMLGAYLAYWISRHTGSFWLALVGGVAIAFAIGLLLEEIFVKRLYGRDHLAQVLLSFGLILVLDEMRHILFGKDVHSVAAAIFFVIQKTRIGMIIRAGAENRDMARALGIPFDLVNRYVFAAGIALAALAGIVVAPISTVFPGMDNQMLILSFVVVVLGSIGSVGKVFFPSVSSISVYLVMAAVLLWRPNGILGQREV